MSTPTIIDDDAYGTLCEQLGIENTSDVDLIVSGAVEGFCSTETAKAFDLTDVNFSNFGDLTDEDIARIDSLYTAYGPGMRVNWIKSYLEDYIFPSQREFMATFRGQPRSVLRGLMPRMRGGIDKAARNKICRKFCGRESPTMSDLEACIAHYIRKIEECNDDDASHDHSVTSCKSNLSALINCCIDWKRVNGAWAPCANAYIIYCFGGSVDPANAFLLRLLENYKIITDIMDDAFLRRIFFCIYNILGFKSEVENTHARAIYWYLRCKPEIIALLFDIFKKGVECEEKLKECKEGETANLEQIGELETDLETITGQLDALQIECKEHKDECEEANTQHALEIEAKDQEIKECNEAIAGHLDTIAGHENTISVHLQTIEDHEADLETANAAVTELQCQVDMLNAQILALQGDLDSCDEDGGDDDDTIAKLRSRLRNRRDEVERLEARIVTLNGEISSLGDELSACKGTVDTLRGEISTMQTTIDEQGEEICSLEKVITRLRAKLLACETAATNAATAAQLVIDGLQGRFNESQDEVTALERQLNDSKDEVTALERQLNDCMASDGDKDQEIADLGVQITSLTQDLTDQKEAFDEKCEELNTEISEHCETKILAERFRQRMLACETREGLLSTQIAELESELEGAEDDTELLGRLRRLTRRNTELGMELVECKANLEACEARELLKDTRILELRGEVTALELSISELQDEHSTCERRLARLRERVTNLEASLLASEETADGLRTQLATVQGQYDSLLLDHGRCVTRKAVLRSTIADLEDRLEACEQTVNDRDTTITGLRNDLTTLNDDHAKCLRRKGVLNTTIDNLTANLNTCESKVGELEGEIETLRDDNITSSRALNECMRKKAILRTRLECLEEKCENHQANLDRILELEISLTAALAEGTGDDTLIATLNQQIAALQATVAEDDSDDKALGRLRERVDQQAADILRLEGEVEDRDNALAAANAALEAANTENSNLRVRKAQLNGQILVLETQLQTLNNTHDALLTSHQNLADQLAAQNQLIADHQDVVNGLNLDIVNLQNTNANLTSELTECAAEVEEAALSLQGSLETNAALNEALELCREAKCEAETKVAELMVYIDAYKAPCRCKGDIYVQPGIINRFFRDTFAGIDGIYRVITCPVTSFFHTVIVYLDESERSSNYKRRRIVCPPKDKC